MKKYGTNHNQKVSVEKKRKRKKNMEDIVAVIFLKKKKKRGYDRIFYKQ